MWASLLSAFAAAKAASSAKDMVRQAVIGVVVGLFLLLAVIFGALSIFYRLEPSWGAAGAAFAVAALLAICAALIHYATAKPESSKRDFMSDPASAVSALTDQRNIEYAQRKVTNLVRDNPLKVSALALIAAVVLARRL
ncbi:MAG: hypothetical protein NW215_08750 [Hyphomicrobiales bacterium]|nr:hypothetical protein [Hyphomicrobiales bacterium]